MTGNPEATRPNATGDIASMYDDDVPVVPPYYPAVIDYPDSRRSEFILRDCATIYEPGDHYDIIRDMETREVIGFAWPLGTNPSIAPSRVDDGVAMKKETEMTGAETTAEEREELHEWAKRWSGYAPANVGALIRDFDRQAARAEAAEAEVDGLVHDMNDARDSLNKTVAALEEAEAAVAEARAIIELQLFDTFEEAHPDTLARARAWLRVHPEPRPT